MQYSATRPGPFEMCHGNTETFVYPPDIVNYFHLGHIYR